MTSPNSSKESASLNALILQFTRTSLVKPSRNSTKTFIYIHLVLKEKMKSKRSAITLEKARRDNIFHKSSTAGVATSSVNWLRVPSPSVTTFHIHDRLTFQLKSKASKT